MAIHSGKKQQRALKPAARVDEDGFAQPHGSHGRFPATKRKGRPRPGNGADPPDDVARGAVTCNGPPARVQCQDSHFYEVPTNAQPGAHREDT